jgi:galactonate dehydratase
VTKRVAGIASIDVVRVPPRWYFVRLRCDDGTEGWGEATVAKRPRAVVGAIADIAENLLGEDADRVEDLWQRMHRGGFFRGGPILKTAAAGIEQALWDAKGRRYGLPIYEFLGGAVRERVRTYAWVAGATTTELVEHARKRLEQGFTAVKVNLASQLDYLESRSAIDAAIERVAILRSTFGSEFGLAVDFHGRANHVVARTLLRELEQFGLLFVEEPVSPESYDTIGDVRSIAGRTPIATGERLTSRAEFKELLSHGVVDLIQPDVSFTGLFELEKICRLAELYDVAVAPHCASGPIALAASLQVAMCCGNVVIQEQSRGPHSPDFYGSLEPGELFDYIRDPGPLETVEGHFLRAAAPGLGIEIDTATVASRAREWQLPDVVWRHSDGRIAEW